MVYEVVKEEGIVFKGTPFLKGELVEVDPEDQEITEALADGSVVEGGHEEEQDDSADAEPTPDPEPTPEEDDAPTV